VGHGDSDLAEVRHGSLVVLAADCRGLGKAALGAVSISTVELDVTEVEELLTGSS
jgi:hypothetical protein